MSNNVLLLAAVGAAVLVMSQKAKAAKNPAIAAQQGDGRVANNVTNELWSKVLGGTWKSLVDANTAPDDTSFLMRNPFGQIVTSDGKPVESIDRTLSVALSGDAAGPGGIISTAAPDGTDFLFAMGW